MLTIRSVTDGTLPMIQSLKSNRWYTANDTRPDGLISHGFQKQFKGLYKYIEDMVVTNLVLHNRAFTSFTLLHFKLIVQLPR